MVFDVLFFLERPNDILVEPDLTLSSVKPVLGVWGSTLKSLRGREDNENCLYPKKFVAVRYNKYSKTNSGNAFDFDMAPSELST